jgi:hypothetical protein
MVCQPNGPHSGVERLLARTGWAAILLAAGLAFGAAAAGSMEPIPLKLPRQATISMVNGGTISGVRLAALGPSQVSYEKAGRRFLPAREVASIAFSGPVVLRENVRPEIRGEEPAGCGKRREMSLLSSALTVQANGDALAIAPSGLTPTRLMDLQQATSLNTLVVTLLRFGADGKVWLEYKSCKSSVK